MEDKNKKFWLIGGVVVALVIIGVMMYRGSPKDPPQGIVAGEMNSITVSDQDPNAVAVLVGEASLRAPGFVAIYDGTNGRPGAIVATSALLTAGSHKNVSIIMNLKAGETYYASLFGDDGNGDFNPNYDLPLTDNSGVPVIQMFKVKLTSSPDDSKG